MSRADILAKVTDVLIRHQRIPLFNASGGHRCVGCDDLYNEPDGPNSPRHATHLATVLTDALTDELAAAKAEGWDEACQAICPECSLVLPTSGVCGVCE